MTIFWHPTGALLRYQRGFLRIEDLNPQWETRWRLSRWEMVKVGLRFILAAWREQDHA